MQNLKRSLNIPSKSEAKAKVNLEAEANKILGITNKNGMLSSGDRPASYSYQYVYFEISQLNEEMEICSYLEPEEILQIRQLRQDRIIHIAKICATPLQLINLKVFLKLNSIKYTALELGVSESDVSHSLYGGSYYYKDEKKYYGGLCAKVYKRLQLDSIYLELDIKLNELLKA